MHHPNVLNFSTTTIDSSCQEPLIRTTTLDLAMEQGSAQVGRISILLHRPFVASLLHLLVVTFLISIGLRPILTTVVVADDFIGPFSMFTDAGPAIMDHLRVSWEAASYGHFNYVGQLIGGLVNWTWMQLMLNGIRYSTIYFFTKLFIYIAVVYAATSSLSAIAKLWDYQINNNRMRIFLALSLIATLQLHLVWSNDPVASYPMSGYASVVFGLIALKMCADFLINPLSISRCIFAAGSLLFAILYYEMNIALIPAIAILTFSYVLTNRERRSTAVKTILRVGMIYAIPALLVVELQRRNAGDSVAYEGTAIRLAGSMVSTFGKLTVSSMPFSSWHLAGDWIIDFQHITNYLVLFFLFSFVAIGAVWQIRARVTESGTAKHRVLWWWLPTFLTYWTAATAIQSSTVKVQNEAKRIGYVYNFYSVGSLVCALSIAAALYIYFSKNRPVVKTLPIIAVILSLCISQMYINQSIQEQHFKMLPQNRNLLVSFSERWPKEARCSALETWLQMGWPTYYSNAMTTGLERSFKHEFGEPFCGRF